MSLDRSKELFAKAREYIPGGVNSPVRAFKAVGMDPLFIKKAQGAKVYDADDNSFIDYVCSWGPLILGHAHPQVVAAICQAAGQGTSYGAPCAGEVELARMICEAFPSIDKVRMVSSGTEATMSAIRLARAYTGRSAIIKFAGCYHGHADSFLIKAGSGLLTAGVPNSPGVPAALAEQTLVADYNDIESVSRLFEQCKDIAAVIVEPVAGNMGLVLPEPGFLKGLRRITEQNGALLIFDEVISGFRFCYGGYQNISGITPDLTTLGKIIGGGLPVGAYGGKKAIMDMIAPEGEVYQAGTLSGNPLAMAAGTASLKLLKADNFYQELDAAAARLTAGIQTILGNRRLKYCLNHLGSMFCLFFTGNEVNSYKAITGCDTEKYAEFFRALLAEGVYFPPSQFELCFVSAALQQADIDRTLTAIDKVLGNI